MHIFIPWLLEPKPELFPSQYENLRRVAVVWGRYIFLISDLAQNLSALKVKRADIISSIHTGRGKVSIKHLNHIDLERKQ